MDPRISGVSPNKLSIFLISDKILLNIILMGDIMLVEKLLGKDINSIDETDLNGLIDVPETRSVEFKTIPDINTGLSPRKQKKLREHHIEYFKICSWIFKCK